MGSLYLKYDAYIIMWNWIICICILRVLIVMGVCICGVYVIVIILIFLFSKIWNDLKSIIVNYSFK